MWKQLIAVACLSCVLVEPIVAQKQYPSRAVQTPDTFRAGESYGRDQTSIGDLRWFEVFKDEELQKLVRIAMVQNYDLREAAARINAARANVGLARSDQFPQFELSADNTLERFSKNSFSLAERARRSVRRSRSVRCC
jgi:multidrug efflux system outer membrane protein